MRYLIITLFFSLISPFLVANCSSNNVKYSDTICIKNKNELNNLFLANLYGESNHEENKSNDDSFPSDSFFSSLVWPTLILIIIILFAKSLKDLIRRTNSFKVGDFQINLKEVARASGIYDVSDKLNNLNYEELRYFLIICGDSSDRYRFTDTGKTTLEQRSIYIALKVNGLLEFYEEPEKGESNNIIFHFKTTSVGQKIHKALLDTIYGELIRLR